MKLVISDNERELDVLSDPDIRLLQDGLDMPLVARELTYAESADSDGRRRVRSKNQNAEGRIGLHISGTSDSHFWDKVDNVVELVESAHRNKGTIRYQPPGGTEMTLDIEAITVTGLPQRGIELRSERIEVEVTFEVQPYGKLTAKRIGGYLTQAELLGPSILLALDSTNKATDLSGNGRNGTAAGGINIGGFATSPLVADPDGSTDFDGTDDRITTTYGTRRNLVPNPSFETNTTGWSVSATGWTSTSLTREAASWSGVSGEYAGRIQGTKDANSTQRNLIAQRPTNDVSVTPGDSYSASIYIDNVAPGNVGTNFSISWWTSGGAFISSNGSGLVTATGTHLLTATGTAPATAATCRVAIQTISNQSGQVVDVKFDAALLERSSSLGTYFDGSVPGNNQSGWLGTAHASASDLGVFANGTTRTFAVWIKREITSGSNIIWGNGNTPDYDCLQLGGTGTLALLVGAGTGITFTGTPVTLNAWAHVVVVFDEVTNTASLYINGSLHQTSTSVTRQWSSGGNAAQKNFHIADYGGQYFDGKMAGLAVYERGLTADEIARLYEAGAAEWRLDGPIDYVTVVDVPGQVVAFGDLELTEASSQTRDFVEIGVQADFDPTNPEPVFLTAGSMADAGGTLTGVTGTAGTASRPAGAYTTSGGNSYTIRTVLSTTPTACATTSVRPHKGLWKIRARVRATADGVRVRLSWRTGNSAFTKERWAYVGLGSRWVDLDLGTLDIPTLSGTQSFEARIEAASQSSYPSLDIDTVSLVPADRYLKLRGRQISETTSALIAADDFNNQTAGTLNGKTPPITAGGNWTGSGDSDDFNVVSGGYVTRTAVSDSADAGRFMTAGTATAAAVSVRADMNKKVNYNTAGLLARYTNTSNYLLVEWTFGSFSPSTTALRVRKRVSGTFTTLASLSVAGSPGLHRLGVDIDANGVVRVLYGPYGSASLNTVITTSDSALATGGALASGRYGFYHENGTGFVIDDDFDNFTATVPSASGIIDQPVVFSGQKLQVTNEAALTASSDGTYLANTPVREGNYLLLPPATRNGQKSRIVVRARRDDIEEQFEDTGLTDDLTAKLSVTPRVLLK